MSTMLNETAHRSVRAESCTVEEIYRRRRRGNRRSLLAKAAAALLAAVLCLLAADPAAAQQGQAEAPYTPPTECEPDSELPQGSQRACEQILDSLQNFSQDGQQVGRRAAEIVREVSTRTMTVQGQTFEGVAIENPLDANDGSEGGRAWEEYKHDGKLILNETFIGCLEPREVVGHPEYNPLCEAICPRFVRIEPGCPTCSPGEPGCVPQEHIVLEHYLPVMQFASNKAGSRSVDVTMFNGQDSDPRLTRSGTSQHQDGSDKPGIEQTLNKLGIETADLKWPEWHKPGEELYLQSNNESFNVMEGATSFPIGYQTRVHTATRFRPAQFWEGYDINDKSGLWCFNDPQQRVVTNAMDHGEGVYSLISRASEFTQVAWPEAYQAGVVLPWNLRQAGTVEQLPAGLPPSFRMQRFSDPYSDLQRLGIQGGGGANSRDWIFYGGTLAPFTAARFNSFNHPIHADIFRIALAALVMGSERPAFQVPNTEEKRHLQLTLYGAREGRQGYTGKDAGIKEPIIFVDKLQLAYPPLEDGDPRRGSECFRIENLANNEPATGNRLRKTSGGHVAVPKDLRRQFPENGIRELNRANETRVVVWTKRVLCACQFCGNPHGCTTLNHGDFEEDVFAGNGRAFTEPPPPFEQLMPFLGQIANSSQPPPQHPPVEREFDRSVLIDDGKTGPIQGGNQNQGASPPSPPGLGFFCIPFFSRQAARSSVLGKPQLDRMEILEFDSYDTESGAEGAFLARTAARGRSCGLSGCGSYKKFSQENHFAAEDELYRCRQDAESSRYHCTRRSQWPITVQSAAIDAGAAGRRTRQISAPSAKPAANDSRLARTPNISSGNVANELAHGDNNLGQHAQSLNNAIGNLEADLRFGQYGGTPFANQGLQELGNIRGNLTGAFDALQDQQLFGEAGQNLDAANTVIDATNDLEQTLHDYHAGFSQENIDQAQATIDDIDNTVQQAQGQGNHGQGQYQQNDQHAQGQQGQQPQGRPSQSGQPGQAQSQQGGGGGGQNISLICFGGQGGFGLASLSLRQMERRLDPAAGEAVRSLMELPESKAPISRSRLRQPRSPTKPPPAQPPTWKAAEDGSRRF